MLRVEAEALLHMGRAGGWRGYRQCPQGTEKLLKVSNVAGRSLAGGHTSPLSSHSPRVAAGIPRLRHGWRGRGGGRTAAAGAGGGRGGGGGAAGWRL